MKGNQHKRLYIPDCFVDADSAIELWNRNRRVNDERTVPT